MNYEKFITDISDFFKDNLPSYIDTINEENKDLKVPYPSKYEFDLPDTFINTEKVVFYLIPWDYTLTEISNESQELVANIKIIITFSRNKEEDLFKIAHRYMTALHQLVTDKSSLNNLVDVCFVRGFHYQNHLQEGVKSIEINFETNSEI